MSPSERIYDASHSVDPTVFFSEGRCPGLVMNYSLNLLSKTYCVCGKGKNIRGRIDVSVNTVEFSNLRWSDVRNRQIPLQWQINSKTNQSAYPATQHIPYTVCAVNNFLNLITDWQLWKRIITQKTSDQHFVVLLTPWRIWLPLFFVVALWPLLHWELQQCGTFG